MTKLVSNRATINEDPKSALIRKLRAEITLLKGVLARAKQTYVMPTSGTAHGSGAGDGVNTESAHLQEQFVSSVNMIKVSARSIIMCAVTMLYDVTRCDVIGMGCDGM